MIAEEIDSLIINAMKAGEKERLDILRMIKNALKNESINKQGALDESQEIAVLKREVKQRKDAVSQFEQSGRQDLAEKEKKEIEIIETFLPQAMPIEEVEAAVDKAIASTSASSMADMGKVIGQVMGAIGDKTDGKTVSDLVKSKLSASEPV